MTYTFKCTECPNEEERNIPMDKIKEQSEKQFCSVCGEQMERVWQPWGGTTLCSGMYGIDGKNGWTTSK